MHIVDLESSTLGERVASATFNLRHSISGLRPFLDPIREFSDLIYNVYDHHGDLRGLRAVLLVERVHNIRQEITVVVAIDRRRLYICLDSSKFRTSPHRS